MVYRLLRPLLFRLDPERAHALAMGAAAWAARHPGGLALLRWALAEQDPRLAVTVFGLRFPNPIGLAAGFDKDGLAAAAWPSFGFGYSELGTVTARAQAGQPRPRLFRLVLERALVNRMGFNNAGAAALAARLRAARALPWWPPAPVGVNVGKSAAAPLEEAPEDYLASLRVLWPVADYLVLNVSSPNTPGLRRLQQAEHLEELLRRSQDLQRELGAKPLLLKIAPDLGEGALDEVVRLCERLSVAGLIATNTTLSRAGLSSDPQIEGGLSGAPLSQASLQTLRALRARTDLPLIASGGIDSAEAALSRFEAGASLVQVYTGWVYGGPWLPRGILRGLLRALDARGLREAAGLVGAGAGR